MTPTPGRTTVRLHLTNVAGAGASQLLQSLLPALEHDQFSLITHIHLPDRGALSNYQSSKQATAVLVYRRFLPNALSRVLECTLFAGIFSGDSALLVFGDLPLRCTAPQTVFVQTPNLLKPKRFRFGGGGVRYWFARCLFQFNMHRVKSFIVQTKVMRESLVQSYPSIADRVHVIAQPVPVWLLTSGLSRRGPAKPIGNGLRLVYPAASYPHKNHALLSRIDPHEYWPVEALTLTLASSQHPAAHLSWVKCIGFQSSEGMLEIYSKVDAVLFLSKDESYGFPLVEAMFIGLPIVCPDLPYAHTICGELAIYFDPDSTDSLRTALCTLEARLGRGWWPCWQDRLATIPQDWDTVARQMLSVAVSGNQCPPL